MRTFNPFLGLKPTFCWTIYFATAVVATQLYGADASATVLNFDELAAGTFLTNTNYAGLLWEKGSVGSGDLQGEWHTPTIANYPNSAPRNLNNAQGSTLMGISFPSLVDMQGAYFAVQGAPSTSWATGIRIHGYLQGQELAVTPWLNPLTTMPQWLDMSALPNVDRIVVEAAPAEFSMLGGFGMDDLTFTYIPEPASLAMLGLTGAGLLFRGRR